MEYTKVTLALSNKRWEDIGDHHYYKANTYYQGELLEVSKVSANIISSSDSRNIGEFMHTVLISNSATGVFTRLTEMGENYAVYEELEYDAYDECYRQTKYLIVVDSLACEMFSTLLG